MKKKDSFLSVIYHDMGRVDCSRIRDMVFVSMYVPSKVRAIPGGGRS